MCVCVCERSVYRADSWACSKDLLSILSVWEATSTVYLNRDLNPVSTA